ncbi:hypothetical protein GDO81_025500, partial [Engystomops pustulosus]
MRDVPTGKREEDNPPEATTDNLSTNPEGSFMLLVNYLQAKEEDMEEYLLTQNPELHYTDPSYDPLIPEEPSPEQSHVYRRAGHRGAGKMVTKRTSHLANSGIHIRHK